MKKITKKLEKDTNKKYLNYLAQYLADDIRKIKDLKTSNSDDYAFAINYIYNLLLDADKIYNKKENYEHKNN